MFGAQYPVHHLERLSWEGEKMRNNKKVVSIALMLCMVLTSSALASSFPPGSGYMNVGGPKDIYSMPDKNSQIITNLAVGEPCSVITDGGDWLEIEYYNEMTGNGTGWVTKNGIERIDAGETFLPTQSPYTLPPVITYPPQPTVNPTFPQATPPGSYGTAIVYNRNGQRLHLREYASVGAKSLGLYYTGVQVLCHTDPNREWVNVSIGNRVGYVKSEFLYKGNNPGSIKPQTPFARVTNNALNEWLNLRSEPSKRGRAFGRYYNGDVVTILGVVGDWYHVKTDDGYGFMLSSYLAVFDTTPSAMPVGSRKYSTTQYIMRGYTVSASMVETSKNNFNASVQIKVNPSIKLNSYPSGYNLYINGVLITGIPTIQNKEAVSIPTDFATTLSFSNDIGLVQIVPLDAYGSELQDEAVFLT